VNAADFAELSESEKRHFSYHEDHVHRPDIQYGGSQSISEEEFSKVERPHRQIGLARRAIEKLKQELLKWKLSGRDCCASAFHVRV
jgi:hypothetical protein